VKEFYKSKVFWFNVLAIIVLVASQFGFGEFVLDETIVLFIITAINLLLRFKTDTGLTR